MMISFACYINRISFTRIWIITQYQDKRDFFNRKELALFKRSTYKEEV